MSYYDGYTELWRELCGCCMSTLHESSRSVHAKPPPGATIDSQGRVVRTEITHLRHSPQHGGRNVAFDDSSPAQPGMNGRREPRQVDSQGSWERERPQPQETSGNKARAHTADETERRSSQGGHRPQNQAPDEEREATTHKVEVKPAQASTRASFGYATIQGQLSSRPGGPPDGGFNSVPYESGDVRAILKEGRRQRLFNRWSQKQSDDIARVKEDMCKEQEYENLQRHYYRGPRHDSAEMERRRVWDERRNAKARQLDTMIRQHDKDNEHENQLRATCNVFFSEWNMRQWQAGQELTPEQRDFARNCRGLSKHERLKSLKAVYRWRRDDEKEKTKLGYGLHPLVTALRSLVLNLEEQIKEEQDNQSSRRRR